MVRPYIGMTDVPSAEWLRARLDAYHKAGGGELDHQLHAGVMMSYNTLNGLPTKWAAAWPKSTEITKIFFQHERVLNVLHYADYGEQTTLADLERAVDYGGRDLNALQLDMPWPSPKLIIEFIKQPWRRRLILQVGARALDQVGNDPAKMIERLREYQGWIDDVLLDKSMGQGRGLDAGALRPFVEVLRRQMPNLGVTVAGGLGPDTLHLVAPLVRDFPTISIDAQGQLRPSGNSLDPIDAQRADDYLRGAVEMFLATIPTGTAA